MTDSAASASIETTSGAVITPIAAPWRRFHLYSFYIDAPEPAIIDTGVTESAAEVPAALAAIGKRIEDVRWILLTHGHIDHIGGAHALGGATGRRAKVVIAGADAEFLQSRQAHVDEYVNARGAYIGDPDGAAHVAESGLAAISGELQPDVTVADGDTIDLGGGISVRVVAIPGHTPGSVAYLLDGHVFVGDAVQVHGAANGFPGFVDPDGYRDSLVRLRDEVRPTHLYLGHPYRNRDGAPYGVVLDEAQAREALEQSIDLEARVREAASQHPPVDTDSPHSPFADAAAALGYTGDPTLEPSPFFTTMHGYRMLQQGVPQ